MEKWFFRKCPSTRLTRHNTFFCPTWFGLYCKRISYTFMPFYHSLIIHLWPFIAQRLLMVRNNHLNGSQKEIIYHFWNMFFRMMMYSLLQMRGVTNGFLRSKSRDRLQGHLCCLLMDWVELEVSSLLGEQKTSIN